MGAVHGAPAHGVETGVPVRLQEAVVAEAAPVGGEPAPAQQVAGGGRAAARLLTELPAAMGGAHLPPRGAAAAVMDGAHQLMLQVQAGEALHKIRAGAARASRRTAGMCRDVFSAVVCITNYYATTVQQFVSIFLRDGEMRTGWGGDKRTRS